MSNNTLTVTVFAATLLDTVFFLSLNIKILKKKLKRWDVNSTIYFIMSLTNVMSAEKQKKERWKVVHRYDDDESAIIMRHQAICLIEILAGCAGSAWLLAKLFAPKP